MTAEIWHLGKGFSTHTAFTAHFSAVCVPRSELPAVGTSFPSHAHSFSTWGPCHTFVGNVSSSLLSQGLSAVSLLWCVLGLTCGSWTLCRLNWQDSVTHRERRWMPCCIRYIHRASPLWEPIGSQRRDFWLKGFHRATLRVSVSMDSPVLLKTDCSRPQSEGLSPAELLQ